MTETTKNSHPKKRAFLAAYALTGNIRVACEQSDVIRRMVYQWRQADPAFVAAMEIAREEAGDLLEEEARRRAYAGTEEAVYGRVAKDLDGQVGTIRRYSDTLLIFLLKGNKPEKFRERVEHTGRLDHAHTVRPDLSALNTDDLDQLRAIAGKMATHGSDPGATGD